MVKVKVKGQECKFVFSQMVKATVGLRLTAHYISTINFTLQEMQVYDLIQNYTWLTVLVEILR